MKIYLDNCCFNRPFDDQTHIRIKVETEAKLKIQEDILNKKFNLVWSYMLEAENRGNPFQERMEAIADWREKATSEVKENRGILDKAIKLKRIGLRGKDALHIACAIAGKCKYFLTTDEKILSKRDSVKEVTLIDPIDFVKEVYL